jgi:hypothetical protein
MKAIVWAQHEELVASLDPCGASPFDRRSVAFRRGHLGCL